MIGWVAGGACDGSPELLFTDNETNFVRLYGRRTRRVTPKTESTTTLFTDDRNAVNPAQIGTKGSRTLRLLDVASGESVPYRVRLTVAALQQRRWSAMNSTNLFRTDCEADEFYDTVIPEDLSRRRPQCDAAGFRGNAVVKTVLSLRR